MAPRTGIPVPQRGVTLVELVIAITIVAIAATAVMGGMSAVTRQTADAMVQQQAVALAQAYLEEVLQRPVADPDGVEPESGRGAWDDIDDYAGLADTGAHDQFGNAIAPLSGYDVTVTVVPTSALAGVPSASARRADVTVTGPGGVTAAVSGYRTDY